MAYNAHLPNTALKRHDGRWVHFHSVLDSPVAVVAMFYASCLERCVPAGRALVRVCKLLTPFRDTVRFAMISLDPVSDGIAELDVYRRQIGATDLANFDLFTGEPASVEHLRYRLGMFDEDKAIDKDKAQHKSHALVISKSGQVKMVNPLFKNPVDFARVVLQFSPAHLGRQDGCQLIRSLSFDKLEEDELLDHASSMSPRYTLPFLPMQLRSLLKEYAEGQRGGITPLRNDRMRYATPVSSGSCCHMSAK